MFNRITLVSFIAKQPDIFDQDGRLGFVKEVLKNQGIGDSASAYDKPIHTGTETYARAKHGEITLTIYSGSNRIVASIKSVKRPELFEVLEDLDVFDPESRIEYLQYEAGETGARLNYIEPPKASHYPQPEDME